jgi:hypothetical protein
MTRLPQFTGATTWLNSQSLTPAELHGRPVLVDFWTYTCINWLRTLPYLRAWWQKYNERGLVIIGVHTPEFSFEHNVDNVSTAAAAMGVSWPIAVDNDYAIWQAFANHYWPALYLADAEGRIRHHWYGEGGYEESERMIQRLLLETGVKNIPRDLVTVHPEGLEVPADFENLQSYENYLGYQRTNGFASLEDITVNHPRRYTAPAILDLNEWALGGHWIMTAEASVGVGNGSLLAACFHARDLNLVMGPVRRGDTAPFRVTLDDKPPGNAHGSDVAADGRGRVGDQRTYQLIRQPGLIRDRRFAIECLEPSIQVLCFTFG